jgi:hypothetical protein
MQKLFITTILLSVVFLGACHKKEMSKTGRSTSTSAQENKNTLPKIKDATIDAGIDVMNTGAAYHIDSTQVNGDILSVFVNYSGGCQEHSFELYSNGMYAKSLPPQLLLCLRHDNKEDACRELINQELKFNIIKLKYPGKNTVILKLGDKQRITYTSK